MAKDIRRLAAPLALGAALVLGACKSDKPADRPESGLASDSALNRDLALAGRDTAAQPQLQDVPQAEPSGEPARATPAATPARTPAASKPAASKPAASKPAARPATSGATKSSSGAGRVGTIAAGTEMSLSSGSKVCTNTNQAGDTFTATVDETVTGSNGARIPAGSVVTLKATTLKRSDNVRDPVVMEFAVVSVKINGVSYPLDASVENADVTVVNDQPKGKTAQKVAIGAAAGAIAGQILGKNTKSTVIGAAAGAAAGAGVAAATANKSGCVNEGASIRVKLNSGAQIRI